jgi:transcription elongation factor GreA
MHAPEPAGEPITAVGIEELRAEIEQLEGPARAEMAARIKVARELGDLKENADYHIAKEDQAHLETRIKRLRERLRNAVVVEVDGDAETFAFGRSAEIYDDAKDTVHTWTLVGSTEADLVEGKLSAEACVPSACRSSSAEQPKPQETTDVGRIREGYLRLDQPQRKVTA